MPQERSGRTLQRQVCPPSSPSELAAPRKRQLTVVKSSLVRAVESVLHGSLVDFRRELSLGDCGQASSQDLLRQPGPVRSAVCCARPQARLVVRFETDLQTRHQFPWQTPVQCKLTSDLYITHADSMKFKCKFKSGLERYQCCSAVCRPVKDAQQHLLVLLMSFHE